MAGSLTTNPVTVTASPAIPEYRASFDVFYGLGLLFFSCPDPTHCEGPGTILVNGKAYTTSDDVYVQAGSTVVLQAIPNPGYVFVGWQPGANQVIQGFQNTVIDEIPVDHNSQIPSGAVGDAGHRSSGTVAARRPGDGANAVHFGVGRGNGA